MAFTHNPKDDTVDLLLVYEGFHASDNGLDDAKAQLTKLFNERRAFLLTNPWIGFSFDAENQPTDWYHRVSVVMQQHVTISHAELFLDDNGKLCGWQALRIRKADEFVQRLNNLLSEGLAEMAAEGLADPSKRGSSLDRETLLQIQETAKRRQPWLRLHNGRISFSLPGSQSFFQKLKNEWLADAGSAATAQERFESIGRLHAFLSETPLSVDQRRNRMTISLGLGEGEAFAVKFDYGTSAPTEADAKLIAFSRKLVGHLKKEQPQKLVADFLQKHREMPHN